MTSPDTISPEHPVDIACPIIFGGGYGHDHEKNQKVLQHIESLGRTAISPLLNPTRHNTPKGSTVEFTDGTKQIIPSLRAYRWATRPDVRLVTSNWQEQRADSLIDHIKEQSPVPIDAIFQSADALNGLLAARKEPGLFNNLVFAFPAGLAKRHSPAEYQGQMIASAIENRKEKRGLPQASRLAVARKKLRSIRKRKHNESGGFPVVASVAISLQNALLTELKEKDAENGPGISLVLGLKDTTILATRVIESLIKSSTAGSVDHILITNTTHGINNNKEVMAEVLRLFPKMEEIKAARSSEEPIGSLTERISFMCDVSDENRERILELIEQLETDHEQQPPMTDGLLIEYLRAAN